MTKEIELSNLLDKIADELNISPSMMEKAIDSYQAVGKWIGDGINFDVAIYPQGSMNLGTVIRPIDDSDDYDMDLVCLLKDGKRLSPKELKNIVGDRLKENETYKSKLLDEGKRCWTMQYYEFHMDILPCSPKDKAYIPNRSTDIRLTHKYDNGEYEDKYSNPQAYHDWFVDRMTKCKLIEKNAFNYRGETEIEKVPTYRKRTVLQKAIQLLKRHRDILFEGCDEDAPISIIITTLAALAYTGEQNLYQALCSMILKMPEYIEFKEEKYIILNPVMKEENFADKWNENPNKSEAFYEWLNRAKEDIIDNPMKFVGIDTIGDLFIKSLGEAPVKRALNKYGEETRMSRDKGTLYVNGTIGGLGAAVSSATKVKGHTFFGA